MQPPDDPHPVARPRRGGRWAALLAQLRGEPTLIICAHSEERVRWLRRQLPGQVVIGDPSLGPQALAIYPPERLPPALAPAVAAARRDLHSSNPTGEDPTTVTSPAESDTPHTHDCPCGCGTQVVNRMFSCRPGWRRLPHRLQTPILNAERGSQGHRDAMRAAVAWFRDHPPQHRAPRGD